jgi:SAM-dependent methyltransferase
MVVNVTQAAKSVYALLLPEVARAKVRHKRRYLGAVWDHWRYRMRTRDRFLAPPHLRFRVAGGYDIHHFLDNGKQCAEDVNAALQPFGKTVFSFENVLDFGCGCGRMLRWFANPPATCHLHGTDIDSDAIAWDRSTFSFAQFSVNQPLPPLPHGAGKFDLIYSHSVFTHIDEEYQFRWLEELRRVTKPGGINLLSVHGKHVREAKGFTTAMTTELLNKGILFMQISDPRWNGIFPDFYQKTFHTEEYIRKTWSRYFEVVNYIERGIGNFQDLVVLRK